MPLKNLTEFERKILNKLKGIPKGKVTTYKILAQAIQSPRASRAVGRAVGKNPLAPFLPCHRVVKSNGELGGYSGKGGIRKKIQYLKEEGIIVRKGKIVDFRLKLIEFITD